MKRQKRDKTKVDPLTGAEEQQPAEPLTSAPPSEPANASNVIIPGPGEVIVDVNGDEVKRVQTR